VHLTILLAALACRGDNKSTDSGGGTDSATPWTGPTAPNPCTGDPVSGFDRLTENAAERGVDFVYDTPGDGYECNVVPGGVVAHDMDGDGDIDLLFPRIDGFPRTYVNDGTGHFTDAAIDLNVSDTWDRRVLGTGVADLDGDGLPEVILTGSSLLLVARNQGDMSFSDFQVVYDQPDYPRTCFNSWAAGDIDGDGDLDLALPGLDRPDGPDFQPAPEGGEGSPDYLFLNQDGTLTSRGVIDRGEYALSLLSVFTDRDDDGDIDLLLASDRANIGLPTSAFLRNDGTASDGYAVLVNDADDIGWNMPISGMGLASWDQNGDGLLDYCLGDIAPTVACFMSMRDTSVTGGVSYYQAASALGLGSTFPGLDHKDTSMWSTWSPEALDLENDGDIDFIVTAAPPPDLGSVALSGLKGPQPDAIWENVDGTNVERSASFAGGSFASTDWHFGTAVADLDRDGYPELIVGGFTGSPLIWNNPCGDGNWLTVDLRGAGNNVESYGARVELSAGGRTQVRELHALRTVSQGPSELYFGIGVATQVDSLRVRWPDGATVEQADIAAGQRITVVHPDG